MEIAVVTILCLVLSNIAAFAYGYGRLKQKVEDNTKRLDRIEKLIINGPRQKGG